MKRICALFAVLLSVCVVYSQENSSASITPGDNLIVENIPAIPQSVADKAARYTDFRSATAFSWHPKQRELLIGTRFGDTVQVHRVDMPQGARTQLTFFPDRVTGA